MQFGGNADEKLPRICLSCRGWREGLAGLFYVLNPFIHGYAEFLVDLGFIIAMDTA